MANSWMEAQKKRKEEERKQYKARAEAAEAEKAAREAKAQEERDAAEAEKARQAAKMAEYQDNVDFYRPGGVMRQPTNVLTREALANAQKTSSPAIDADAALQKCVKEDTKELPNAQAIELLNLRIAEARAAGVREGTPNLKRALALVGTLETASKAEAEQDTSVTDPNKDSFDALFGGYAEPQLDDDLMW